MSIFGLVWRGGYKQGNRVLYSDNLGKTWNVLGNYSNAAQTAPKGDEAKIEELPN